MVRYIFVESLRFYCDVDYKLSRLAGVSLAILSLLFRYSAA